MDHPPPRIQLLFFCAITLQRHGQNDACLFGVLSAKDSHPLALPEGEAMKRVALGFLVSSWICALGLDFLWFRLSVFKAGAAGTKTSVAYFRSNWLGMEGVFSTAFAPKIYAHEHAKLLTCGAGPKIVWRRPKWDPWMHAILGGAHEFPRTAAGGKNGLGVEPGGADYHIREHLSARLEGNYILTRFFSQTQSNFQLAAGFAFDF